MSNAEIGIKKDFGIVFNNPDLLTEAFTHGTYLHDNLHDQGSDYQRLEFLGDSVMQLSVADFLYRSFPKWDEGQLTEARISMVQSKSFAHFSRLAHFDEYVLLNKSSEQQGFRNKDNLLEDLFESFVGALYIDQGREAVKSFLDKTLFKAFKEGYFDRFKNYKSLLQELLQKAGKVDIEYKVLDRDNQDENQPDFHVELLVNGVKVANGEGGSIKEAETQAAQTAYQELSKQ